MAGAACCGRVKDKMKCTHRASIPAQHAGRIPKTVSGPHRYTSSFSPGTGTLGTLPDSTRSSRQPGDVHAAPAPSHKPPLLIYFISLLRVCKLTFHQASLRSLPVGHSSTFVEVWVQSPTLQEPRDARAPLQGGAPPRVDACARRSRWTFVAASQLVDVGETNQRTRGH